jgi:hypothetical protein
VGNNGNAGTSAAAPKQTLASIDVNTLPAGSRLFFARGGAWTNFSVQLRNLNVTAAAPLVFDAYTPASGATARPWLKVSNGAYGILFGPYNDTANDGGYTLRNLKLDGQNTPAWGVHLRYDVHDVLLDNMEITGFELGVHSQNTGAMGNTNITIRNTNIHRNSGMGMLGDAINLLIEGTTFANNNFSGSSFNHGIYLSGHGRNGTLRNNTFSNNSAVNGVCTGGNVTVHGQWDGLVIEGNRVSQVNSSGSCYGISIVPGYHTAEWFRNVVVRGNTVENVGGCGICAGAAPGIVVERNKVYLSTPTWLTGILIPTNVRIGDAMSIGDDVDRNPVVRDNVLCFSAPSSSQTSVNLAGVVGATESGTITLTGAAALTGACAR